MKQLVTFWRALIAIIALLTFSAAHAQQPCGIQVDSAERGIFFTSPNGEVVSQAVYVTNTSGHQQNIKVFVSGDSAAFHVEPWSFTIEAGASKLLKILFKPYLHNQVRYSATLHLSITAGTICKSIEMVGEGKFGDAKGLVSDPASWKYPATPLGTQSCKVFWIKNAGASTATISGVGLISGIGAKTPYSIKGGSFPTELKAGEKFPVEICFAPTDDLDFQTHDKLVVSYKFEQSNSDGVLAVNLMPGEAHNGGKTILSPAQYRFPGTAVGQTNCATFTLYSWDKSVVIKDLKYVGDPEFKVTTNWPLPANVHGDSVPFYVCFTPTASTTEAKGTFSVLYSTDGGTTFTTISASFYGGALKPACLAAEPGDDWTEPILDGGKDDRFLLIFNKTGADITISDMAINGPDASAFKLEVRPPITIAAFGKVEIPFTFMPTHVGHQKYYASLYMKLLSNDSSVNCHEFETALFGVGLTEHKDTTHSVGIKLFPEEKQTIGLSNRGIKESYTLLFVNNMDKDVVVESISLADGTKFKIDATEPATTPFTLKPEETFTVTISFESNDGLLYKDKLIIVSDFAAMATEIDMQGINAEKAFSIVSRDLPEGVSVQLMPNPMQTSTTVDFEGIRSAKIEVVDVLGTTIQSVLSTSDWKWNGQMVSGNLAPAGTYFIRVQGESLSGEQFVTTRRVIVK